MENFILGLILVCAILYFGYKLYPKKNKGCGCNGASKNSCKNNFYNGIF